MFRFSRLCSIRNSLLLPLHFHVYVIYVNSEPLTGKLMEEESHMMNYWTKPTALDAFYHCVFKHCLLVCPNYTFLLNFSFCVWRSLLMI